MVSALQALDANLSNFQFSGGNVGIGGTTDPNAKLLITSVGDGGAGLLSLKKYDNSNAMANGIGGLRARGTLASPSALQTNDRYFSLIGAAHDGTTFSNDAAIQMYAGENHTATAHGSFMSFETAANGESVRSERIRIDSLG